MLSRDKPSPVIYGTIVTFWSAGKALDLQSSRRPLHPTTGPKYRAK